jgi:hypothetical protein
MEFHIFAIHDKSDLRTHPHRFNAEDEGEAISKARQYAEISLITEGTTVGLFKQDSDGKARAIIAWRKMPRGTLRREEPLDAVESLFHLTSMDFEYKIRSWH